MTSTPAPVKRAAGVQSVPEGKKTGTPTKTSQAAPDRAPDDSTAALQGWLILFGFFVVIPLFCWLMWRRVKVALGFRAVRIER